ncbi:MAG: hypothetical protein ACW98K_07425 [Candidatus Kariarchaeaceae archaeon]
MLDKTIRENRAYQGYMETFEAIIGISVILVVFMILYLPLIPLCTEAHP